MVQHHPWFNWVILNGSIRWYSFSLGVLKPRGTEISTPNWITTGQANDGYIELEVKNWLKWPADISMNKHAEGFQCPVALNYGLGCTATSTVYIGT